MAGENKKDAYVRLRHILIVLLVFTAIAVNTSSTISICPSLT